MSYYLLLGFFLTLLFELIISFFFIKNKKNLIFYILLINLFTWPIANFISLYINIIIIEGGVIFTESFLLMFLFNLRYKNSLILSLLNNIVSYLVGVLIFNFIS